MYSRSHAGTKAGAFGGSLIALGVMLCFREMEVVVTGGLVVIFFYVSAPLAAQMVGGGAHRAKVRMWVKGKREVNRD